MLQGKKTYLVALAAGLVAFAVHMGYITKDLGETIMLALGAAGLATLRAAVSNVNRKLVIAFLLLLAPSVANAQTTAQLQWDYLGKTPSEIATHTQAVLIDGVANTAAINCVAKGTTDTTCTQQANSLATGTHTVAISASKGGLTTTTTIQGISATNNPPAASNPKVNINITINIGTQ